MGNMILEAYAKVRWALFFFLVLLLAFAACSCGPMLNGSASGSSWSFVVVVHNTATVPVQVSISTPLDGYAAVNSYTTIPAGGSASWLCGQNATPSDVFLHNPLTWGGAWQLYWYDQIYRAPSEYGPTDRFLEIWYP